MTTPSRDIGDVNPSRNSVWEMFDRVAHRYDLLNHLLSFGQDILWRSKLSNLAAAHSGSRVVDVATGTADQLISMVRRSGPLPAAIGIDMSGKMLDVARHKLSRKRLTDCVTIIQANALNLPLRTDSTDTVTISFGIRNVVDISAALREMKRILRAGGKLLILEFSTPRNPILSRLYLLYLRYLLPQFGSWISGDSYAYHYLNKTIESFPSGDAFSALLQQAGFSAVSATRLTGGVVTIYQGTKLPH